MKDDSTNLSFMTQNEYKNLDKCFEIVYRCATSIFGKVMFASTSRGNCFLAFGEERLLGELKKSTA